MSQEYNCSVRLTRETLCILHQRSVRSTQWTNIYEGPTLNWEQTVTRGAKPGTLVHTVFITGEIAVRFARSPAKGCAAWSEHSRGQLFMFVCRQQRNANFIREVHRR